MQKVLGIEYQIDPIFLAATAAGTAAGAAPVGAGAGYALSLATNKAVGSLRLKLGGTLLTSHPHACDDSFFGPVISCKVGSCLPLSTDIYHEIRSMHIS